MATASPISRTITDVTLSPRSGFPFVLVHLLVTGALLYLVYQLAGEKTCEFIDYREFCSYTGSWLQAGMVGVVAVAFFFTMFNGYLTLEPNQAAVLSFFGRYVGTVERPGLLFVNPFYTSTKVSARTVNFQSETLKVNDKNGNPIEIAAVVVWQVRDAASAIFSVGNYQNFVKVQAEAGVRLMASKFAYEHHGDETDVVTLRDNPEEVSAALVQFIQERVKDAGILVVEARLSHLAYAPEIAQAMLQRQQAAAVVAARTTIVEGAVGMVRLALEKLQNEGVVEMDSERKAQMVSNLLVVLCGDRSTQPVVNAGSIHS